MEYAFKNSKKEPAKSIFLHETHFILHVPGKEETISYGEITSVQLSKSKDRLFKLQLKFENRESVTITNKYYLTTGQREDRSRYYSTFVRVLHFHLKEKGHPNYKTGFGINHLLLWIFIAALGSTVISFISEYYNFRPFNSILLALLITFAVVIILLVTNKNQLPKIYSPEDIPLQFLP